MKRKARKNNCGSKLNLRYIEKEQNGAYLSE
jgi:hypothetical protein